MANRILVDAEERMKKALESSRRELAGIRTGKASPGLLDTVKVEAYGQMMSLKEVGQVSAPEPRLLLVQPWDKALIKAVSRAIQLAPESSRPHVGRALMYLKKGNKTLAEKDFLEAVRLAPTDRARTSMSAWRRRLSSAGSKMRP